MIEIADPKHSIRWPFIFLFFLLRVELQQLSLSLQTFLALFVVLLVIWHFLFALYEVCFLHKLIFKTKNDEFSIDSIHYRSD